MDFSASALFASLVVSTVGFGFFMYGKKQVRIPQLSAGITLMVFPYFVASALPMLALAGAVLFAMHLALRNGA